MLRHMLRCFDGARAHATLLKRTLLEVQGINTLFKTQTCELYTLFKTGMPENHTLSSGTSPYSKYRGVKSSPPPPPPGSCSCAAQCHLIIVCPSAFPFSAGMRGMVHPFCSWLQNWRDGRVPSRVWKKKRVLLILPQEVDGESQTNTPIEQSALSRLLIGCHGNRSPGGCGRNSLGVSLFTACSAHSLRPMLEAGRSNLRDFLPSLVCHDISIIRDYDEFRYPSYVILLFQVFYDFVPEGDSEPVSVDLLHVRIHVRWVFVRRHKHNFEWSPISSVDGFVKFRKKWRELLTRRTPSCGKIEGYDFVLESFRGINNHSGPFPELLAQENVHGGLAWTRSARRPQKSWAEHNTLTRSA